MHLRRDPRIRIRRLPGERSTRIRLGAYEVQKKGVARFDLRDPYHLAIALSWPQFLALLLSLYLLANLIFATLFWLVPGSIANARPHQFSDAFFFSIETLATVGYGDMYPATLYGRSVATAEIICGVAFIAILTGLTFVRFSRPQAKLIFAPNAVVAMHNGKPTLMVRLGNARATVLSNATASLNLLVATTIAPGKVVRRAQELRLERAHVPIFPLTWTLMHVLDERSPLHGYDEAQTIATHAQIFVIVEARDPTLATIVHDFHVYLPKDIRFGMRYIDIVSIADDGTPIADLTMIGGLEPDLVDRPEPGWTDHEEEL